MKRTSSFVVVLILSALGLAGGQLIARAQTPESAGSTEAATKPGAKTFEFSKFVARVETENDELEVSTLFTLSEQSGGINPLSQPVSLKVGEFSTTIPANSFKASTIGWFKYEGTINGVDLEVRIAPLGANRYAFRAEASAKGLSGPAPGKTDVELSIDDNRGKVSAKVERGWL